MKYRLLGSSGLRVTEMSPGTMTFGGDSQNWYGCAVDGIHEPGLPLGS
jgi:aryl-alcohol dehydrogenase-like predicted oxidoreductase